MARKFYFGEEGNQGGLSVKDQQNNEITPLISIAIHPSGYYLAAGFIDKLRIFHILHSELRQYREISLKAVTNLRFSAGGHLLACSY